MSETLIIVADNERERDRGLIELAKSAVETNTRLIVAAGDDRLDRLGLTGVLPWGFECERELLEPEFPPTQELATALKRHRASLVAVVPPLRHPGEFERSSGRSSPAHPIKTPNIIVISSVNAFTIIQPLPNEVSNATRYYQPACQAAHAPSTGRTRVRCGFTRLRPRWRGA